MKYAHVYALFLASVFFPSCGQNKTTIPKDNIESETKDTVSPYWSNTDTAIQVKQGSNGAILIASLGGVFRSDTHLPDRQEKSFTNLTKKLGTHKF